MAVNLVILGELRFGILILPTGKKRTARPALTPARLLNLQARLRRHRREILSLHGVSVWVNLVDVS